MQARRQAAGSARTTATGRPAGADLSQHLPEGLLSRLDTGYGLTRPVLHPEGPDRIDLSTLTMTGHLTGERLA